MNIFNISYLKFKHLSVFYFYLVPLFLNQLNFLNQLIFSTRPFLKNFSQS